MDGSRPSPDDDGAALNVTALLRAHVAGDPNALAQLLPHVYEELRRMARRRLARERARDLMSTGEIVHDAILTLLPMNHVDWQSRGHFLAVASRAMRNVLVNHAMRRRAAKRGGGRRTVPLDELPDDSLATEERPIEEMIDVNDALVKLERMAPRRARVVECLCILGLNLRETAEVLGISLSTVSRDWAFARAWLSQALSSVGK